MKFCVSLVLIRQCRQLVVSDHCAQLLSIYVAVPNIPSASAQRVVQPTLLGDDNEFPTQVQDGQPMVHKSLKASINNHRVVEA